MGAFNSKEYAWKNISINILGKTVIGVTEIEYETEQEKEYVYGKGNDPIAIQAGNKAYKGKIELLQSEVEALELAARTINPTYDITDVTFDIVVSYADGILSKTDRVKFAEITKYAKGMKQGDKNMKVSLDFMALSVERGVI